MRAPTATEVKESDVRAMARSALQLDLPLRASARATPCANTLAPHVSHCWGTCTRGACSKVKGLECPVCIYNRTASRAETLAAEFGAQAITSLEGLSNISVIVSTIPPEGASVLPDALLANKPIMLDASYMPGGAPLTKRATAAGCDVIVGPQMLFEQVCRQRAALCACALQRRARPKQATGAALSKRRWVQGCVLTGRRRARRPPTRTSAGLAGKPSAPSWRAPFASISARRRASKPFLRMSWR